MTAHAQEQLDRITDAVQALHDDGYHHTARAIASRAKTLARKQPGVVVTAPGAQTLAELADELELLAHVRVRVIENDEVTA